MGWREWVLKYIFYRVVGACSCMVWKQTSHTPQMLLLVPVFKYSLLSSFILPLNCCYWGTLSRIHLGCHCYWCVNRVILCWCYCQRCSCCCHWWTCWWFCLCDAAEGANATTDMSLYLQMMSKLMSNDQLKLNISRIWWNWGGLLWNVVRTLWEHRNFHNPFSSLNS